MEYTEADLRKAFQAGILRGYFSHQNNYFDAPFDEGEYIESLNAVVEEDKVSFTYSFLCRKLDWEKFCELTGTNEWAKNEGATFGANDIYHITESKAKQFNLI